MRFHLAATPLALAMLASPVSAQFESPLVADSFRLGSGGGTLCRVQTRSRDAALDSMFDRAWTIVCRDAARPVGKIYALRGDAGAAAQRLARARAEEANCGSAGTSSVQIEGFGTVSAQQCALNAERLGYSVLTRREGNISWVAEGLSAYDSALKLALHSVVRDRIVPGQVSVATSGVDDPAAFARVQAGTLDPDQALAEGYRRNNSGSYAEAAEFFDTLQQRTDAASRDPERIGEYLVNRALQKSNLGDFAEAESLFAEARRIPTLDKVQVRLRRNFEALHLMNQGRLDDALARISEPVAPIERTARLPNSAIEIAPQVAAEINSGVPTNQRLGATEASALTPEERAIFLDAQALQIKGSALRLAGKPAEGQPEFERALSDVVAVREGRVTSVIRLRSQILGELGLALEDQGQAGAAEARMREAVAVLELRYPQTVAVNSARARLAAFLARNGKTAEAMAQYKMVVDAAAQSRSASFGLGNVMAPYLRILSEQMGANPSLANDMLLAMQVLVRPGVADTQAILSRELSEGSDESARLFRQSRTLERDIERTRIELANLRAYEDQNADVTAAIAVLERDLASLGEQQTSTQAKLAQYPQFRAISTNAIGIAELRAALKPGEAYFKLTQAGQSLFGIFVDAETARGYRINLSAAQLEEAVSGLRDTISVDEGGQRNTYPFDVQLSYQLFTELLGPVQERLAKAGHLIFEPDGAMLKLPANLLVTEKAGLDAYLARTANPQADAFDFRGIAWLGRKLPVTTALSPRSFRDARAAPASTAARQYLGFGQNQPVSGRVVRVAATRGLGTGAADCLWPDAEWNKPISDVELRRAQSVIGAGKAEVITGSGFSDSAIRARSDLTNFRILHFATHGLVTAPRAQCPARPALLTSFGGEGSDGLLSFTEIYDLKLNADLVILSACDTAGQASVAATREAGVTSGGGNALDGLVRAFIGAGGRTVLASHWPAPDDFQATERLVSGLFQPGTKQDVGRALQQAQIALMDDANTSHPFYWAGFAVIGDGAQAMLMQ